MCTQGLKDYVDRNRKTLPCSSVVGSAVGEGVGSAIDGRAGSVVGDSCGRCVVGDGVGSANPIVILVSVEGDIW